MNSVEMILRKIATDRGIDPDTFIKVVMHEGGVNDPYQQSNIRLDPNTGRPLKDPKTGKYATTGGIREPSFGPLQLNIKSGVGAAALRAGIDPRTDWVSAAKFGADRIVTHGWGEWYGAKKAGITGKMGIGKNARPLNEGARGALPYTPTQVSASPADKVIHPPVRQVQVTLHKAGLLPAHAVTGKMNSETSAAIKRSTPAMLHRMGFGGAPGELPQAGYKTGVKGGPYSPDIGVREVLPRARVAARTSAHVPLPRERPTHVLPQARPTVLPKVTPAAARVPLPRAKPEVSTSEPTPSITVRPRPDDIVTREPGTLYKYPWMAPGDFTKAPATVPPGKVMPKIRDTTDVPEGPLPGGREPPLDIIKIPLGGVPPKERKLIEPAVPSSDEPKHTKTTTIRLPPPKDPGAGVLPGASEDIPAEEPSRKIDVPPAYDPSAPSSKLDTGGPPIKKSEVGRSIGSVLAARSAVPPTPPEDMGHAVEPATTGFGEKAIAYGGKGGVVGEAGKAGEGLGYKNRPFTHATSGVPGASDEVTSPVNVSPPEYRVGTLDSPEVSAALSPRARTREMAPPSESPGGGIGIGSVLGSLFGGAAPTTAHLSANVGRSPTPAMATPTTSATFGEGSHMGGVSPEATSPDIGAATFNAYPSGGSYGDANVGGMLNTLFPQKTQEQIDASGGGY